MPETRLDDSPKHLTFKSELIHVVERLRMLALRYYAFIAAVINDIPQLGTQHLVISVWSLDIITTLREC
jgi:hypothetical protein